MRRQLAPLVAPLALLLAACGGSEKPKAKTASGGSTSTAQQASGSTSAGAATPPSGTSGGTKPSGGSRTSTEADPNAAGPHVTLSGDGGRAHWVGEAPAPAQLTIEAAKSEGCHDHGAVDTTDRSVLVGADGGLANVVIEVAVKDAELAVAEEPFVMDQHGCRYEPHVLVMPAGATIEYRNSDTVGHNVHTYARRNTAMNQTVAAASSTTQVYAEREQVEVKCDIHPWMNAWVYVSAAPFRALSAADGSFALPGLPPGEHKLSAWHEELGAASGTVVVAADGSIAELDLVLRKKR